MKLHILTINYDFNYFILIRKRWLMKTLTFTKIMKFAIHNDFFSKYVDYFKLVS